MSSALPFERLIPLIEPRGRLVWVTTDPEQVPRGPLEALGCRVTIVSSVTELGPVVATLDHAAEPGDRRPCRFDTAILATGSPADPQALGQQLQVTLPLLSERGSLLLVITGAGPIDREALDRQLHEAGLIVGHAESCSSTSPEDVSLIVLAFPLPAIDITVFRERARGLERRAQLAEQQVEQLDIRTRQLQTELEAAKQRAAHLNAVAAGERDRLATLHPALARAEAQSVRARADLDEARSRVLHADADRTSLQRELHVARAELELARASQADAAAQVQVLRHSFSWRLTAPVRRLAGWFGRTTTDRALGWRE